MAYFTMTWLGCPNLTICVKTMDLKQYKIKTIALSLSSSG